MKYVFLMFLIFLTGCVNARQVSGPGGGDAFEVVCGIAAKYKCIEKAASMCPHGYKVFDHNSYIYNDLVNVGSAGSVNIKSSSTMTMLIQCK